MASEGRTLTYRLPEADSEVLPGVRWGRHDCFGTPAYWRVIASRHQVPHAENFRLGRDLPEEVAACLLGGFGMAAELGMAAFVRVRDAGLLAKEASFEELLGELSRPFQLGGRLRKYRYPKQKAGYLSKALTRLLDANAPVLFLNGIALRDWLLTFDGIGPKTAAWIARNHLSSDEVAILDVHVIRAGKLMGLFSAEHRVDRDYPRMESRFVAFAKALEVRASLLDALIWEHMRTIPLRLLSL